MIDQSKTCTELSRSIKTCGERSRTIENPKIGGGMKRFVEILAIFVTLAICGPMAEGQQTTKIPRIGCYMSGSHSFGLREESFRQGLAVAGDPVGTGLVESLAQPGGNITGLTLLSPELSGKRLEILKETAPKLSRVAVLLNPANPGTASYRKEAEVAARSFGVELHLLEARRPDELASALSGMKIARVQALVTLPDAMFFSEQIQIASLAAKSRLPAIFPESEFVNAGGLMSYGPNLPDLFRRAAIYVDKILKGAKPADLPVEQPTKFELVINLKTAKQIGLIIPPNVLARADRVIR
jgi:putative ABC transport system substrate-binding protein